MTIRPIFLMINTGKNRNCKKAALRGAAIASGIYTAGTAITWAMAPREMQRKVKEYGGKQKYAAALLTGMAILSAGNAAINMAVQSIYNKVNSHKK